MQFHLNGFRAGNPEIAEPCEQAPCKSDSLPNEVDVLIVGCGPAGLTLAAQLAAFPDIKTQIVEQKSGPLLLGQADGIACRTMEMFEAFGFSERVMKEACWINETTFWKPDDSAKDRIARHGRMQDVEDGLSEFPHVVLNQARVHDYYLDVMRNSASRLEPLLLSPPPRPAGRERLHWQHSVPPGDRSGSSASIPRARARSRRSRPGMSWVATGREASCASPSGACCAEIRQTRRGV